MTQIFRAWLYEEPLNSPQSCWEVFSSFHSWPHVPLVHWVVEGVCGLGSHPEPQNNCSSSTGRDGEEWEQGEKHLCCRTQRAESYTGIRPGLGCQQDFTLNASTWWFGDRKLWLIASWTRCVCWTRHLGIFTLLKGLNKAVWVWRSIQRIWADIGCGIFLSWGIFYVTPVKFLRKNLKKKRKIREVSLWKAEATVSRAAVAVLSAAPLSQAECGRKGCVKAHPGMELVPGWPHGEGSPSRAAPAGSLSAPGPAEMSLCVSDKDLTKRGVSRAKRGLFSYWHTENGNICCHCACTDPRALFLNPAGLSADMQSAMSSV